MRREEFTFKSNDGTSDIHAVKWMPDNGSYKAVFQISHGMIEYIERYEPFAEFMTEHGFMVVGHDHIGHGHSVKSENDYGYFPKDDPSGVLVSDMHTLRTTIQKENTDMPYFMFGHSMGSYMLRKYLSIYGNGISGALICGTGYVPAHTTGFGLFLTGFAAKIHGGHYRSQTITNMTYNRSYRKFDMTGKDSKNSWLTRDSEIVEEYYKNPMCAYIFTMNGYRGLMEAVRYDCRQENVDKVPDDIPLYIISGDDDPVGDLGAGVRKVYEMFLKSGKKDVECKLYKDFRHEILNEIGKEQVYNDILAWTTKHM